MKIKVLALSLILCLLSMPAFAARANTWTVSAATNEVVYNPSTGVYQDVGAKSVILTTINCTGAAYSVNYYAADKSTLVSSETLSLKTVTTLLSPYFKLGITASGGTIEGKGLVYIY